MNTQPFGQIDQMFELCSEYISVPWNWLHVVITSRIRFTVMFEPASSKHFLDIQATTECGFTLIRTGEAIITYRQMHRTDKYSEQELIIWSVRPTAQVFFYRLSGSGWEWSCSQLNIRFCACFAQWVPWHSRNYRVYIHSETRMWHDKNIASNARYR